MKKLAKPFDPSKAVPPRGGTGVQKVQKVPEVVVRKEDDRVYVNISRKVNLAKYEMLEVGVGSTVSVHPGETLSDAIKRVAAVVRAEHADIFEVVREDADV